MFFAPPLIDYIDAGNTFDVTEETLGAYVMTNMEGEGWRGNMGVRVVETTVKSNGFERGLELGDPGTREDNFFIPPEYGDGYVAPVSDKAKYTDVLPSANFVFDVTDQMLIRIAAARTMTRANFNQLSGFESLNPTSYTGTGGGGADLDPFRANQFDASFEWYMDDDSAFNVGFFYKDLNSLVATSSGIERRNIVPVLDDNGTPDDATDDFAATDPSCVFQSGTFPNEVFECDFDISRPRNVAGATIQGIELAYQRPLFDNFGMLANYTYTDAEQDGGLPLPQASKQHLQRFALLRK